MYSDELVETPSKVCAHSKLFAISDSFGLSGLSSCLRISINSYLISYVRVGLGLRRHVQSGVIEALYEVERCSLLQR